VNAVKLVLEKPLGDATTWSAGYKADLVFGPDADYYASRNTTSGAMSRDNFAVKQAYVALRAPVGNGLDLKMGVWDTLIGYEFFESGANPNYSRSYGYSLEPTHHTGLLASYKITDMFSVSGGIANAYTGGVNDRTFNGGVGTESKKTYLAAITITLPESAGAMKNSVISLGYVGGQNGAGNAAVGFPVNNLHDTRSYYAGFTLNTPVEGLTVGAAWDYRQDAAGLTANNVNDAYAVALYATFGRDKWKLNLRGDYTQATSGTYYVSPGDRNELLSVTGDLEYNLWENVLPRLELRWDRALSGDKPFGISDENAVTVALNAIYKF